MDNYSTPSLPTDILYKIPTSISDPASLARLGSSCKLWRSFIKDRAFLDRLRRRHRDHGFTPSLLLGFFYQENTESAPHLWQHEMDKNRCLAPSFTPTSELSRFIGSEGAGHRAGDPLSLGTFIQGLGASLNFYDPIASRDSFLVLRHRSQDSTSGQATTDPDVLRVCNPLTGENFDIPPLRTVSPDLRRYALYDVADDVGPDGRVSSRSFQLVAVLIKEKKFIYSCYSSKTRYWRRYPIVPELMDGLYPVSPPAAVSHGAVHWLCGSWKHLRLTHVATLHVDAQELSYLELPPEAKHNKVPPLLASSADGGLLLLYVQGLEMSLWKHDRDDELGSSWVLSETIDMKSSLPLRVVKLGIKAKIRLEMFQGKSGTVLLWVDDEGLFLFSLSDGSMKKIDSEHVTQKYRLCPYEIDWLSCLAITNLVVDGSLSLDEGRKKARDRWRTLMAWRPTKHAA